MGTGKSYWVDKALEHEKGATLVSTRISQTIGIIERNPMYKSYKDEEHKGYLDVSYTKFVVQYESLKRVEKQFNRPLIVDELMSVFYQALKGATPKNQIWELLRLFKESSSIVLMDKYIEPETIKFFTDFVKTHMPDDDWVVDVHVNGYQQHLGSKVSIYDRVTTAKSHIDKFVDTIQ